MREHLYSHLNRKFGVPAVIEEWATSIVAALDAHAEEGLRDASFRLVLGNALDEEYRAEQRAISATVEELVRANVRSKHPTASEETLRAKTEAKLRGDLLEREWLDMVRFMYGRSDGAPLKAQDFATRSVASSTPISRANSNASRSSTPFPGREGSPKRNSKRWRDDARRLASRRENSRRRVCFTVCARGGHRALRGSCRGHGRDGRGRAGRGAVRRAVSQVSPGHARGGRGGTLLRLDPWNSGEITAAAAYAALTPGLEAEEKGEAARGLPAGEASRASLWGGGRGELTWGR